ncbi:MAG TPA: ABC transporter ATP-binding protein, partial [Steroidobacteraceae bacterium]|nr:ABC transporter ATP-binding protein [Steroidobacteraceae bacterium]
MDAALLTVTGLGVSAGKRVLVADLSLELVPGEFIAVLGRNGCGKSLTLHTLAGLRLPAAGHVELAGHKLRQLRRGDVARALAFLPQDREDSLPLSVFEAALLGRHPHIGWLRGENAADVQIVHRALARMDVD